jgi:uncharacterized glyoxalase superfamily protein PhnB/ketosteroid isomerase-like protein
VSLITLGVADVGRARRFYESLGWEGESPDGEVVFFQTGGSVLALWSRALLAADSGAGSDPGGWGGVTLAHNVGSPGEVDEVLSRAAAAGATVVRAGAPTSWGGYAGLFADPDGHRWEVAHNPAWELAADGSVRLHPTADDDRESVAGWMASWGDEVAAADLVAGRQRFAADLVAFGTHADVVRGRDAVEEQQWSRVWPAIEDFAFDLDDLEVLVSPDRLQAVAVVPWTSTGIAAGGERFPRPGRATVVLTRAAVGAPWVGRHTHFSLARGVPPSSHGRRPARR